MIESELIKLFLPDSLAILISPAIVVQSGGEHWTSEIVCTHVTNIHLKFS